MSRLQGDTRVNPRRSANSKAGEMRRTKARYSQRQPKLTHCSLVTMRIDDARSFVTRRISTGPSSLEALSAPRKPSSTHLCLAQRRGIDVVQEGRVLHLPAAPPAVRAGHALQDVQAKQAVSHARTRRRCQRSGARHRWHCRGGSASSRQHRGRRHSSTEAAHSKPSPRYCHCCCCTARGWRHHTRTCLSPTYCCCHGQLACLPSYHHPCRTSSALRHTHCCSCCCCRSPLRRPVPRLRARGAVPALVPAGLAAVRVRGREGEGADVAGGGGGRWRGSGRG